MSPEPKPYQYSNPQTSLGKDAPPFRLLHLWPGKDENPLYGEIHESQLNSSVAQNTVYEALSYCCGAATEVARITIKANDGGCCYLPVGHNLHNALLGMRSPEITRVLWVDAICINQNDLDERAQEVRQMHRIYQCAKRVLIWLDEPKIKPKYWNPALAFAFANRLAELRETEPDLNLDKMGRFQVLMAGRRYKIKRHIVKWNSHDRPPDALRLIFQQPWFERMWVVQEAICATTAVFICGYSSIDFDVFMHGIEFGLRSGFFVTSRRQNAIKLTSINAPLSNLSAAMEMYLLNNESSPQGDLLSLLRRFHGSKSADPRDKLFALYGISSLDRMNALAHDFAAIGIVPDYQVNPAVLYTKVARGILQQYKDLDLLSIPSRHEDSGSKVHNLPSWVPDWSVVNQRTAALYYNGSTRYSASKNSRSALEFPSANSSVTISAEPTISLSGFYFDRIAEVGIRRLNKSWKGWNNPGSAGRADLTIMVTFELWIWQIVDWQYDFLEDAKIDKYLTVEEVVNLCGELILFTRNQFETPWFLAKQEALNTSPKHWGRWFGQQVDKLYRKGFLDSQCLFFSVVMLSMFQKGLIRGMYDDAIVQGRTLAMTENGHIGLVPLTARPGDSFALCCGGNVPLVIRRQATEGGIEQFKLVGDAYVHGIMDGQAWNESRCGPIVLS